MSADIAIEVKGLEKTFMAGDFPRRRRVHAVVDVSLVVKPGQVFGLLGPNGAGKSTTIKVLLGLIRQTHGTAMIFGKSPSDPRARAELGYLPENPMPYEYLTGEEFIELSARLGGVVSKDVKSKTAAVIERVGMAGAKHLQIRRYSKGMVQRIALAQALVASPRLLILDEPTSGLDVLGRRLVRDLMVEERDKGTTVLFCSHIIPDVEALCDEVALIIGGRTVKHGSVRAMLVDQQASVEVVLDGLTPEEVARLTESSVETIRLGERVSFRLPPNRLTPFLQAALASSGRVVSVAPLTYSLEDLFLEEVRKQGGLETVGVAA